MSQDAAPSKAGSGIFSQAKSGVFQSHSTLRFPKFPVPELAPAPAKDSPSQNAASPAQPEGKYSQCSLLPKIHERGDFVEIPILDKLELQEPGNSTLECLHGSGYPSPFSSDTAQSSSEPTLNMEKNPRDKKRKEWRLGIHWLEFPAAGMSFGSDNRAGIPAFPAPI